MTFETLLFLGFWGDLEAVEFNLNLKCILSNKNSKSFEFG